MSALQAAIIVPPEEFFRVTGAGALPWERQAYESRQAFQAFALYRDLGPARSLARVGRVLGKSTTLMERWSARWRWVARAAAYDDHRDAQRRGRDEREALAACRRQVDLAVKGQAVALAALEHLDPCALTPYQVRRLLETSIRLEMECRGRPKAGQGSRPGGAAAPGPEGEQPGGRVVQTRVLPR